MGLLPVVLLLGPACVENNAVSLPQASDQMLDELKATVDQLNAAVEAHAERDVDAGSLPVAKSDVADYVRELGALSDRLRHASSDLAACDRGDATPSTGDLEAAIDALALEIDRHLEATNDSTGLQSLEDEVMQHLARMHEIIRALELAVSDLVDASPGVRCPGEHGHDEHEPDNSADPDGPTGPRRLGPASLLSAPRRSGAQPRKACAPPAAHEERALCWSWHQPGESRSHPPHPPTPTCTTASPAWLCSSQDRL